MLRKILALQSEKGPDLGARPSTHKYAYGYLATTPLWTVPDDWLDTLAMELVAHANQFPAGKMDQQMLDLLDLIAKHYQTPSVASDYCDGLLALTASLDLYVMNSGSDQIPIKPMLMDLWVTVTTIYLGLIYHNSNYEDVVICGHNDQIYVTGVKDHRLDVMKAQYVTACYRLGNKARVSSCPEDSEPYYKKADLMIKYVETYIHENLLQLEGGKLIALDLAVSYSRSLDLSFYGSRSKELSIATFVTSNLMQVLRPYMHEIPVFEALLETRDQHPQETLSFWRLLGKYLILSKQFSQWHHILSLRPDSTCRFENELHLAIHWPQFPNRDSNFLIAFYKLPAQHPLISRLITLQVPDLFRHLEKDLASKLHDPDNPFHRTAIEVYAHWFSSDSQTLTQLLPETESVVLPCAHVSLKRDLIVKKRFARVKSIACPNCETSFKPNQKLELSKPTRVRWRESIRILFESYQEGAMTALNTLAIASLFTHLDIVYQDTSLFLASRNALRQPYLLYALIRTISGLLKQKDLSDAMAKRALEAVDALESLSGSFYESQIHTKALYNGLIQHDLISNWRALIPESLFTRSLKTIFVSGDHELLFKLIKRGEFQETFSHVFDYLDDMPLVLQGELLLNLDWSSIEECFPTRYKEFQAYLEYCLDSCSDVPVTIPVRLVDPKFPFSGLSLDRWVSLMGNPSYFGLSVCRREISVQEFYQLWDIATSTKQNEATRTLSRSYPHHLLADPSDSGVAERPASPAHVDENLEEVDDVTFDSDTELAELLADVTERVYPNSFQISESDLEALEAELDLFFGGDEEEQVEEHIETRLDDATRTILAGESASPRSVTPPVPAPRKLTFHEGKQIPPRPASPDPSSDSDDEIDC